MYYEGFKCIVCGSIEEPIDTGYKARDKDVQCVRCTKCGHHQLYPIMTEEEYKIEYDEDLAFKSTTFKIAENGDFETARLKWAEWTKKHVQMYYSQMQQHRRILNIGSGYGFFEEALNKIEGNNFSIEGVEIGRVRLDNYVGGTVHNINFSTTEVPDNMKKQYDLLLCMHLLEHLTDPVPFLQNIKPLLKDGGECIFEVPNHNCYLCELSEEYKKFFYLYEHVSNYDMDSISTLFRNAGYRIKRVYTKEIYSLENHLNWIRTGKPFIKYNQMYMPDDRLEWINEEYHNTIESMNKGYSLIIEVTL